MPKSRVSGRLFLLCMLLAVPPPAAAVDDEALASARALLTGPSEARAAALEAIEARGSLDMAAPVIELLRFLPYEGLALGRVLDRLAGQRNGADWKAWMLWQEEHDEVVPFDGFDRFKSDLFAAIDPEFSSFIHQGVARTIRLEEIAWGGVRRDGIPALVDPAFVETAEASWMTDEEPVFGVSIAGDTRAYPLRIMDWHEMANDVVGGVPVALAYCTLCGSAILYRTNLDRDIAASGEPNVENRRIFRTSGFLYRSNKLMYDEATNSLWNQFTGRPVVGELAGSDIDLPVLPVTRTSWRAWRDKHPTTKILDLDTGYERDYSPGRPYGAYFASGELMFPTRMLDRRLDAKAEIVAVRLGDVDKAWPLAMLMGGAIINDRIGELPVVVLGDAATRTARVYERSDAPIGGTHEAPALHGSPLEIGEERLLAADGESFARLPSHIAYWFAWQSQLPNGELADGSSPER